MRTVTSLVFSAAALLGVGLANAPASAKTASDCNAEYAANKPAIQAAKQKKSDFLTACRAGTETIPGSAAALVATPAVATTPAPAATPVAVSGAPSVTKQCGDKWSAAKAAGTTGALTWPKFLSQCRSEMAAQPAAATSAASAPTRVSAPAPAPAKPIAPASAPVTKAATPAPMTAPAATGNAVFPTAVSSKYSTLSAGKARMQTCLDQYNANKATNGNGGLKWIEKGGGYYSQCNGRLKG